MPIKRFDLETDREADNVCTYMCEIQGGDYVLYEDMLEIVKALISNFSTEPEEQLEYWLNWKHNKWSMDDIK